MITNSDRTWTPDACQLEVIRAQGGYHLVLAPPGCGKTQILTERIRTAHDAGTDYADMLCLTFTNRAARGMKERIRTHLGDRSVEEVYVGNVHRFCSKFLYDNGIIPAESSVIDDDDAISILARYLDEDEYAVGANSTRRRQYAEVIQLAGFMHQIACNHPRSLRMHPECITQNDVTAMRRICAVQRMPFDAKAMTDIFEHTDVYFETAKSDAYDFGTQQIIGVLLRKMSLACHYKSYKQSNKLLDFEDLLMLSYDALRADLAAQYKRYSWIQVDEVQDLNPLQLAIVDALTATGGATTVYLGDEQQAIFSFMGAKTDTLGVLKERCNGNIHHLNVNHRSPAYLLEVFNDYAEQVLRIDKALLPVTTYAPCRLGDELRLVDCNVVETELHEVADIVGRLFLNDDTETTAIIVNSNSDADAMSEVLRKQRMPHFKVSGADLFSSSEVKQLFAHLNILANENNFIAWARMLKGLHVFESNAASRNFMRALLDRAMLPTDFLLYENSTYVQDFYEEYENREIVIFDTETTGLSVFEDDILQIAAVTICRGEVVRGSEFKVFIATEREIPRKLGDIDNPIIEEMKHNRLLGHAEALQLFMNYVGDRTLLGHNADYDYHILDYNLRRYLPQVSLAERCPKYFDSLKLIRLLEPDLREYKLKYLLSVLHLEGENSHLADADVHATCNVVAHCYRKAADIIGSQRQFIVQKRVQERAEVLRKRYVQQYLQARRTLYLRPTEGQPAMVGVLVGFYRYMLSERLMEPVDNLNRIVSYLCVDMIDVSAAPSLAEQLSAYSMQLNTLKEADLCGSSAIDDRIFVTTVHKAKGLEFDNVVIFDAVEGRYPNYFNKDNPIMVAEDARKFYVAMSRAKKRLYVAYSSVRIDYHNRPQPRQLTRFMQPIAKYFTT